ARRRRSSPVFFLSSAFVSATISLLLSVSISRNASQCRSPPPSFAGREKALQKPCCPFRPTRPDSKPTRPGSKLTRPETASSRAERA
uniref:Secreted protein n=1 Tax=Cucumis melo TaxID=3656 RepID=A0A9I9E3I4_CUCME